MTATMTPVTPDTRFYILTADFAGYTLEDCLLGTMSAGEYVRLTADDDETAIAGVVDACETWLGESLYHTRDEANSARDDDGVPGYMKVTSFTPRDLHERVMENRTQGNSQRSLIYLPL